MPIILRRPLRFVVIGNPYPAVRIKEQIWVDSCHRVQPDGLAPRTFRIFRRDDEVSTAFYARCNDVEQALMVPDRRRKNAAVNADSGQVEYGAVRDSVPDLRPVYEISAVVDRQARDPAEGRVHNIKVLPHAHDAGVRLKTGKYRIALFIVGYRQCIFVGIATLILHRQELD